ncbi:HYR domain-containing protein [Candidatus Binatia bacterium]|nr:HYR domain-containing protein [Candidatus Binatia bacterium]
MSALAVLLVFQIGCSSFGSLPGEVADPEKNAVLCSCECDPPTGPIAIPFKNVVATGADDAAQAGSPPATLTGNQLGLGQNTIGLRFQKLGVPPQATITAARIQFTAAGSNNQTSALQIHLVDSPNAAPFGPPAVDLGALPLIGPRVDWSPGPWDQAGDAGANEQTADLASLLQVIVNDPAYTPDSAVAFIIQGAGLRRARAFEANSPQPPYLTVEYSPKKATQEFLTCAAPADAADPTRAAAVCEGAVESNVSDLAKACNLASACTCTLKTADAVSFSKVCKDPCPSVVAPQNCDPAGIAQTTQATAGHTPVCVANSPLGSMLTGRLSACDLDQATSKVLVQVRDEDGEDQHSASNTARGRVNFVGTPCPDDPLGCFVGMNHRINVNDLQFSDALDDHRLTEVTGVGENTVGAFVDSSGAGSFAANLTNHSVRGVDIAEDDGGTKGFYRGNDAPLAISVGDWQPGGACSLSGKLIDQTQVTLQADLHGTLVNQPPIAVAGDDQQVECNFTGGGEFTLDGSESIDPDNNVVSYGWFKGSRTGSLVGALARARAEQLVSTPTSNHETSYVLKVIDSFGQYDEDTTTVDVVDTRPPTVMAPAAVTAECTGPSGTSVVLGTASASDVCDDAPILTNDAPPVFNLGSTTVTWTAIDESNNKGTATQTVKIVDTTPPKLTLTLAPTSLWPPNHKLAQITASITVSDVCDPNPTVRVISITSNEPDNGLGDGDTTDDIQQASFGTDDRAFLLRSERSGRGNGRVYTVTYEASDASGNKTVRQATVTVAKSQ